MDISAVIITHNGKELLERYLPSVFSACGAYRAGKTEVILVDNGSGDGSGDWARSAFPGIRIVRSDTNDGFAKAANAGLSAAKHGLAALFNDDIEVTEGFFASAARHFSDPAVFAVRAALKDERDPAHADGPKIGVRFRLGAFDPLVVSGSGLKHAFFAGGGASVFEMGKFRELGGFDELFCPFYWEDVDLSYRAWKRGWTVMYEPEALVYHQGGATIWRYYSRSYVASVAERNKYLLLWKNLRDPGFLLRHALLTPLKIAGSALKGDLSPLTGLLRALPKLGGALAGRRAEAPFVRRTDAEVLGTFAPRGGGR